ncbi:MAG: hypothetical protein QM770_10965 [Tepidisphaeraceae bacterium]
MRFLVHVNLTSAVNAALVRHGHIAVSMQEAILPDELPPSELLQEAHRKQLDVITADRELAQFARTTAIKFDRSIVFLQLRESDGDVEQDDAIDRLFDRFSRLKPGMLYTVTEQQVKTQQLKGV